MENMGAHRLVKEMAKLNPGITIFCDGETSYSAIIVIGGCKDYGSLKYPEGYYYTEKNGVTNKHNTRSGMYECFDVFPKHIYEAMMRSTR